MSDLLRRAAELIVREDCRKRCPALLCERDGDCKALLYDTPGFYEEIQMRITQLRAASTLSPPEREAPR